MVKKTLIVNLYGGPSTGKSSMCAGVFSKLKWRGVDCEMAREYAKDKVWEMSKSPEEEAIKKSEPHPVFRNQLYILGKQHNRIFHLEGKVDVVITDCPLLLNLIYATGDHNALVRELAYQKYKEMDNLDIFLRRIKPYNPNGRMQTEDKAKQLDDEILHLFDDKELFFFNGEESSELPIAELIIKRLGKK